MPVIDGQRRWLLGRLFQLLQPSTFLVAPLQPVRTDTDLAALVGLFGEERFNDICDIVRLQANRTDNAFAVNHRVRRVPLNRPYGLIPNPS